MKFVVTGCPRSATGYMSVLFNALNIPCTHEVACIERTAMSDLMRWYGQPVDCGESSWLAWAFLGVIPGPVQVIHVQRNPWLVIDSLAHRNDLLPEEATLNRDRAIHREAIRCYAPEVFKHDSAVDRAAQLLLSWHKRMLSAIGRSGLDAQTIKVEDLDCERTAGLLDWLGIYRSRDEITRALTDTPHNVNGGKTLTHNVKFTPELAAEVSKSFPGLSRTPTRLISEAIPLGRDELISMMNPDLASAVDDYAAEVGYSRLAPAGALQ